MDERFVHYSAGLVTSVSIPQPGSEEDALFMTSIDSTAEYLFWTRSGADAQGRPFLVSAG